MSELIWLIIWLVCALLVAGALLGVVRAILATPLFKDVQPYANVIYALVVLVIVLVLVSMFMNGVPTGFSLERHRG